MDMSTSRLAIGLLFGGESPEHEVSIVTARSIAQHLDPGRFEVRPLGIARNGVWVVTGDPLLGVSVREKSDHWRMSLLKAKR
jgi:D-alanine-D-alanine ligase